MDEITLFFSILIAGVSAIVFIISLISTIKLKNIKFLLVGIAFFAFLIKGLLLAFEVITQDNIGIVLDILVVVLLYFAIVKK
jgi:hypothetical protein